MPKIISPLPLYVDMNCDLLLLGHCCNQVVGTVVSYLGDPGQNLGIETGCPELFCGFNQSIHAYAGSVSEIRPWPLSSTSFPVHYSLIIPVFGLLRLLTLSVVRVTDSIITYTVEKLILRR